VALGLVASLARPGGNLTGINFFASEIEAKRLGLIHELLPKAKRVAVLVNPTNSKTADATVKALREAAPGLGVELLYFKASTAAEIDAAFAAMGNAKADALFIAPDGYFSSRGSQMATLAARDRMPTSNFVSDGVAAGLLMGYGTSIPEVFRQAAIYVAVSSKAPSWPIYQFCNRPNSSSFSICKRHVLLGSTSRRRCSPAPTR
jgi:putative ABC transport system substrate-binding protein